MGKKDKDNEGLAKIIEEGGMGYVPSRGKKEIKVPVIPVKKGSDINRCKGCGCDLGDDPREH